MRFMMIILPAGYATAPADFRPDIKSIQNMMPYNIELHKAGICLALDGLHPGSTGVRITKSDGKAKVTDGPFAEAKEAIGGYWILEVASREEAIEWASRCPLQPGDTLELRQLFDMADFPPDVQKFVMDMRSTAK